MSAVAIPLTMTTGEVVAALEWAVRQTHVATEAVIGRDRRISSHIARKIAAEHHAHARALYEVLKVARAQQDGQWATVPVEPTTAMLQGGCSTHVPGEPMRHGDMECPAFGRRRRVWADMLATAPRPA